MGDCLFHRQQRARPSTRGEVHDANVEARTAAMSKSLDVEVVARARDGARSARDGARNLNGFAFVVTLVATDPTASATSAVSPLLLSQPSPGRRRGHSRSQPPPVGATLCV